MALKKIPHLIRYFFALGVISFAGYVNHLQNDIFIFLTGPCLYIAHALYAFVNAKVTDLADSEATRYYVFLLPICLLYYTFIGFQLKQLLNERGKLKWVLLTVFVGFLIYIHFLASQKLSGYLTVSDF